MISIIYPRDDFRAADISIKIAMDIEDIEIFPVPKYPGRNENLVFNNLNKSQGVIFIMTDPSVKIDSKTKKEIEFVLTKGKEFYAVVPEGSNLNLKGSKVITYKLNNINDLIEKVHAEISNLKRKREYEDTVIILTVLAVILIILIMFLTLNAVAKNK